MSRRKELLRGLWVYTPSGRLTSVVAIAKRSPVTSRASSSDIPVLLAIPIGFRV